MNARISPRLSRLLALAVLVFLLVVPYMAIVRPYLDALDANRDAIGEQAALRDRYVGLAAGDAASDTEAADAGDEPSDEGGGESAYLEGASEALVAADLQNRVKTVVQDNGGVLNSTQILETTSESGFRRLAVRVRMSASMDALYKVLYELETQRPFLFTDNIDINARSVRMPDRKRESVELIVSFDLFGFMRAAGS
ncbi:MAG: type II secretion system protein M [Rhodospirillales bacterium]|nr:type II secretion system protein M [Rhodospirillales bacterium]